jgi:pimeloyl-ACP methyl ester carboxylesterase
LAKDAFIARWQKEFPDATLIELHDTGHHIQEDAPVEIATAIRSKFST